MANMCEREKFEIIQRRKGKKWQPKISKLTEEINQLEMRKVMLEEVQKFDLANFYPNATQEKILHSQREKQEYEWAELIKETKKSKLETAGVDQKN